MCQNRDLNLVYLLKCFYPYEIKESLAFMVQPLAFETMTMFQLAGFKLKEIIIKEQHNCQATGYWKTNSIKYNFLLLAHEYLFVFKK